MESFFATNSRVADEESTEIVLVNPRAGSGAALRNRQCWKRCLSGSYEVVTGANAAETERLAAEATRQGVRRLSVVGGDGTIHHACNGYLSVTNSRTQLRIIPFGTANDYAASLRLHARQVGRESFEVDVGQLRCGDFKRYFVNVAGLGLTARAAALSRSSKWFPSRIRYLAGLLRTMTHDWQYSEIRLQ
ncbi:MAG: hypothetical protein KDB22_08070, partial [Planctomycetales bacterium]|nr:hypothetical protein [Planctomycetales bacterium]